MLQQQAQTWRAWQQPAPTGSGWVCSGHYPGGDAHHAERDSRQCVGREWLPGSTPIIRLSPQKRWVKVFTKRSGSHVEPERQVWVSGSWSASSPVACLLLPLRRCRRFCCFTTVVVLNLVIVTHKISFEFFTFLCSFNAAMRCFPKPRLLQRPLCSPGCVYDGLQPASPPCMPVLFSEQTYLLTESSVLPFTAWVSTQKLSIKIKFCLPEQFSWTVM